MLSKLGKKSAIFGSAAALAATPLMIAPVTGQAESNESSPSAETLLDCNLDGNAGFSPALGLDMTGQETQMQVSGQATDCTGDANVESATFEGDLAGQMSCTSLPRDVGGEVDITWKMADGSTQTSKASFTLNMAGDLSDPTNPVTGDFEGTGSSGSFTGAQHHGEAKINPASVAGGCLTGGVQSLEFSGDYTMA